MSGYTDYVTENCMNSLCLNILHIQMAAQLYLEFTCGVCQDKWKTCKALLSAPAERTDLVIHSNCPSFILLLYWTNKTETLAVGQKGSFFRRTIILLGIEGYLGIHMIRIFSLLYSLVRPARNVSF